MKVFLSWSGDASKAVAEALHHWLPGVIQHVQTWTSAEDISKGARWGTELARQLECTRFGIICVTSSNTAAPWLLFEAGALSKTLDATFVCPYLLGIEPEQLPSPLAQFQAARADREDTKRLVHALNRATGEASLPEKRIDEIFNVWWPRLHKVLNGIRNGFYQGTPAVPEESDLLEKILDRIQDLAPQPVTQLYFLVSFDRTAGVGVYEFSETTHQFQVGAIKKNSHKRKFDLSGQIEAGFYFSSLEELLAFCRREYFKDKKDICYAVLFTKRLRNGECQKTLRLLNEPQIAAAGMSRMVFSMLKEAANPDLVASVIAQAHRLGLGNVMMCFRKELREITLSPPVMKALRNASSEGVGIAAGLQGD